MPNQGLLILYNIHKHFTSMSESLWHFIRNTYSIIWVEYIRGWRIIHNDHRMKVPAELVEVFDVVAPVKYARLPEESRPKYAPPVQQICHRISILQTNTFIRMLIQFENYIVSKVFWYLV